MEYNYFTYTKEECNLTITKLPIWFKETNIEGDENKGIITFETSNNYDEIWGPNAKIEIEWSTRERVDFEF